MNPDAMTTEQLVQLFVEFALKQDRALFTLETSKYNKLYDKMSEITGILKSRPGDQRHALVSLYGHENHTVRVKAAIASLALELEGAKKVLQEVWDLRWPIAAPLAGEMLFALEEGRYIPK